MTTAAREDVPSWEEYYMALALLTAQRSKDPKQQVGCCIVNTDKRIVGIGYNGFPSGCPDTLPWESRCEESRVGFLGTKHAYVCHAEMNAVVNALSVAVLKGSTMYVTHFPCNECTKLIIQTGIARVIYLRDVKHDSEQSQASRRLMDMVGIKYSSLESVGRVIELRL